jgi:hypothetical protein
MNTQKIRMAALVLVTGLSGTAQGALQGRDLNGSVSSFEAYYDTVLDITWLADANYAKTSGYDADGLMNWATANTWAANLSFTDGVNVYDNWRLPTVSPVNGTSFSYVDSYNGSTDFGHNISEQDTAFAGSTSSEMMHLFYNTLNNKAYCDPTTSTANFCAGLQAGWGLTNTGPFTSLPVGYYWYATEYALNTDIAWGSYFSDGYQTVAYKYSGLYALAVSPGDVAAVPEAQTYALMLAGLGMVGFAARHTSVQ